MKYHDFKTDTIPIYHDFEDGRFYLNSPSCIISSDQIVQIGTIYLFSDKKKSVTKLLLVKLLNVRFDAGLVYLQLMDIMTSRVFEVHQVIRPGSQECPWMIVDMDYFNEKLHNKKADHSKVDETLLEFEF
jgi:hypothetical protein